jgi:hypothetical protein
MKGEDGLPGHAEARAQTAVGDRRRMSPTRARGIAD